MSARIEPNPAKVSRSLVTALATAFVVLSVLPLLLVGSILGYFYFYEQGEKLFYVQQVTTAEAAQEVSGFIEQLFSALEASVQVGQVSNQEQQRLILEKLLGLEHALREVVLVDKAGQKIVEASRHSLIASTNLVKLDKSETFAQVRQDQRFISAVYIDEVTSEPLVILAVPVKDVFGDFQGALLAEVNLKFMWEVVDKLEVGQAGTAYVVDKQGNLIAFKNETARVLKGANLSQLSKVANFIRGVTRDEFEFYTSGINGAAVVATYIPLGSPDWAVMTEIPVEEAYYDSIITAGFLIGVFLLIAILAAGAGIYASRYLTTPLLNLTQTATRLAAGEIELQASLEGPVEVVRLATAFNHMTRQLQELIDSLEQRVADRTQRLQLVATLGERLLSTLNSEELLEEVVNQVKENFGYYHTHIYLLDDNGKNLVVAAGTGEAGAQMKAKQHSIALNAQTSLVARAARSGEVVKVDNVREAADWLPNPLLPNTYSEMAVPIMNVEGRIVGVLDVQEDEVAGLDESDVNLLRSLVSLIAVAINNARLFAEVETALAKAYATQGRYIEQSWQKSKAITTEGQYHYMQPGVSTLAEATLAKAKHHALAQKGPTLAVINESNPVENSAAPLDTPDGDKKATAIVAPIILHNQAIGALQLYPAQAGQAWTEDDIAITEAVINQLVQTAENLRLFEETRERANFERLVSDITDKLYQAPSLNILVKTAAEELGQALGVSHSLVKLGVNEEEHGTIHK